MSRASAGLLAVLEVLVASSAAPALAGEGTGGAAAAGLVYVKTDPAGAEVFLDDGTRPVGVSPCILRAVSPGRHEIRARLEGRAEARADVAVVAGKIATVELRLGGEPPSTRSEPEDPAALGRFLEEYEALVERGDLERAAARAREVSGGAPGPALLGAAKTAAEVADSLLARRSAVLSAAASLVGREVELKTSKGVRRGVLEGASEAGIVLSMKIAERGRVLGETRLTIPLGELSPEQEDELARAWAPAREIGAVARAMLALARKDARAAEKALAEAGELGGELAERCRRRIETLRLGPAEAAARAALAELERTASVKTLSASQAKIVLAKVEQFARDHGSTRTAAEARGRLADIEAKADAALLPSAGLVAHWRFDEARGETARDYASAAPPMRLKGASWVPGRLGSAVSFDGTGEGLAPESPAVELGADFTISVWLRTTEGGAVLSKSPADGPWAPDGKLLFVEGGRVHFDSGWVGFVGGGRSVTDGDWHHAAVVFADATDRIRLYVDGIQDGERTLALKRDVPGHVLRIAFAPPRSLARRAFAGAIDDLRIYARVLGEEELMALALAGRRPGPQDVRPGRPGGAAQLARAIFDGRSMAGWKSFGGRAFVEEGSLVADDGADLSYPADWEEVSLELEIACAEGEGATIELCHEGQGRDRSRVKVVVHSDGDVHVLAPGKGRLWRSGTGKVAPGEWTLLRLDLSRGELALRAGERPLGSVDLSGVPTRKGGLYLHSSGDGPLRIRAARVLSGAQGP